MTPSIRNVPLEEVVLVLLGIITRSTPRFTASATIDRWRSHILLSEGLEKLAVSTTLRHDYQPMEAQTVTKLPFDENWQYEPKWDGFRCIAFKDGGTIDLRSKTGRSLTRYFPEVVNALKQLAAAKFVLDGELVIQTNDSFSFDHLLQRIHPAESRVKKLSAQTPATLIVFDLLVGPDGKALVERTLDERRKQLELFAYKYLKGNTGIQLSPATTALSVAKEWLKSGAPRLDGVIAKRRNLSYQSGNRNGMVKVKHLRTADCVIGGFRYGAGSRIAGSLLLGLYDKEGLLHHVGFTSGFSDIDKQSLTTVLEGLVTASSFSVNIPGAPSRWSSKKSTEWVPVKPELVIEVQYDHVTADRFRHGTRFLRWRPDKLPRQCSLSQLQS